MSPRPLGGIAEENENDLLDDIGALDLDRTIHQMMILPYSGMAFWLKCRSLLLVAA